jgi:outer membrane protein assembly factor BamB
MTNPEDSMRYLIFASAFLTLGADWPQYFGPNRDGTSSETGLVRSFPAEGPKVLWRKDTGSGWSGPAVAGERAILFYRSENNEVVECVDVATGKEKWKKSYRTRYVDMFDKDNGPRATPLIVGERIFTLGAEGTLTAFSLSDGAEIWQRNVNKDYKVPASYFGVGTSPMMAGGKLIVNIGAKGAGIVAFDPADGKEVWKSTDQGVSYSSPVLAKIDGEELAVFFTRQGLLALTPDKGEVRYEHYWRPRIDASVNAASPIVAGNQIFLSTSYNTGAIALEASKGEVKEVWKGDKSLSCHYNTPVLVKGYLYGIDGRQEYGPRVRCVEWKTGTVKWTKDEFGCATLIVADGMIIAFCESGELVLIDPSTESYKELARAAILDKAPCRAAPALSGGKLISRDSAKWICVDLKK